MAGPACMYLSSSAAFSGEIKCRPGGGGGGVVAFVVNVYMAQGLSLATFSLPSDLFWIMVWSAFPGLTCCAVNKCFQSAMVGGTGQ